MTAIVQPLSPDGELAQLSNRLGQHHASRRLALELEQHRRAAARHRRFFCVENWAGAIRYGLRVTGLHKRGQDNARRIQVREHCFNFPRLPEAFTGFRILHLSDLHLDMDPVASQAIAESVEELEYDICVMTGDYRANTFGESARAMAVMESLRERLRTPVYAVLGNHDSIHMVPRMEAMDIRVLMNEGVSLSRDGDTVGLAGIDDAHHFRLDDIPRAFGGIASEPLKILLSHTPEVFHRAAEAGFDGFLCGHTHGGQICLPGGIPLILESDCPRFLGRGPWRHRQLQGYTSAGAGTSVLNVRLNCPAEITVHTLLPGEPVGTPAST